MSNKITENIRLKINPWVELHGVGRGGIEVIYETYDKEWKKVNGERNVRRK